MSTPYEKITATIIEALQKGEVAWQKPWLTNKPCNAITGKEYRGINPFLLNLNGKYADHRWLTYKQAKELGGTVRQGEKATWIVFYTNVPKKNDVDGSVTGSFMMMKAYFVFNVEQCDGLDKLAPLEFSNAGTDPNIVAEEIWAKYTDKPEVEMGGGRACYSPSLDVIKMPKRETFTSNAHFYATLFHEGAHSTGHAARLNRKSITENTGDKKSEVYSYEELVAEFTSAFLCAEAGIEVETQENSVAYLQGWISALQNDSTLVVKAASMAQKAADYMLKKNPQTNEEPIEEKIAELVA